MNITMNTATYWLFGVSILAILNFILVIVVMAQKARLKRKLRHWQSVHATADLEDVYNRTIHRVEKTDESIMGLEADIRDLWSAMKTKVGTPNVKRYNAFSDTGSDLSFSVALLDDTQTGVVLSSIYGREESRTYGKPVVEGQSSYPLTDEEEDVLSKPGTKMKHKSRV